LSGSGLSGFLVGWAKPVPVNPANLRNPRMDDLLVTLAGPWMNLLLAIVLMGMARVGVIVNLASMTEMCMSMAHMSLLLFFFNLLPIPPLDGSRVARVLIGMSYEAYYQLARYGFIILILVMQVKPVMAALYELTSRSHSIIAGWFGLAIPM
jgi:Zn-dependent protease